MSVYFGPLPDKLDRRIYNPNRNSWQAEAAELKRRPGEWGRLTPVAVSATAAAQQASAVRNGLLVAFRPSTAFIATTRGNEVWVKYIGTSTINSGEFGQQ